VGDSHINILAASAQYIDKYFTLISFIAYDLSTIGKIMRSSKKIMHQQLTKNLNINISLY